MTRKESLLMTALSLGSAMWAQTKPAGAAAAPKDGIPVAFVVGPFANVIDLAGSWEVFSDTFVDPSGALPPGGADTFSGPGNAGPAFSPYTVSDSLQPIKAWKNLTLVPDHTYRTAPRPAIVVMGAQRGHTPAKIEWIRETSRNAEVVMSVCTGAFLLAQTGLLDGKRATTHHDYYDDFAKTFPKVQLVRGPRFVDEGKLKTAGGLTSGIALALHVVEEMYGKGRADLLARYLEYVRTDRPA
jgi:putative intracellular protease/amidase